MIKKALPCFRKYKTFFLLIVWAGIVVSCANMAQPTGGERDFDPPVVLRSVPDFNATHVKDGKIQIYFDELVQIENPSEKVIVTPPQRRLPRIQAISNRVIVELRDTLLPNTTYTIDFTDAIADNNEKNTFDNFSISFSTGDVVDSLAISGKVLSAANLEPVKSIYVGLHSDLSDSAFLTKPFERISRTNEQGEFTIKGISEGKYRLYALQDLQRSYMYQDPSNMIAYLDSLIVPTHTRATRPDTLYNEQGAVDTVIYQGYTRFLPDNIVLRSFVSSFKRQYLQKHERLSANEMNIFFGGPTQLPQIKILNYDGEEDWYELERKTPKNDTLKYWITDPYIMQMDTVVLAVSYQVTDTLNQLVPRTDTLNFINRNKPVPQKEKKKKDKEKEETRFLGVNTTLRGTINVFENIDIRFDEPVSDFDKSKFALQRLIDSTYVDEKITNVVKDTLDPKSYSIKYKWQPGASYRFMVDSAAFHTYTGLWNNKIDVNFKIKALEEYGNLYINLTGLNQDEPAFVELLNNSDKAVRKSTVKGEGVLFMNLDPGKYYARIIIDENDNGMWDTGDYYQKRQPEEVYYYTGYFDIKANWDIEENWDIRMVGLSKQKPLDITKNKPKDKDAKRKEMERRDAQSSRQSSSSSSNMMSPTNILNR